MAGLHAGQSITRIQSVPIEKAVREKLGGVPANVADIEWALRRLVAGPRNGVQSLEVSDAELKDELRQGQMGAMIFPEGKFIGQEKYTQFVQGQFNMTVETFEKLVKLQVLTQKLPLPK